MSFGPKNHPRPLVVRRQSHPKRRAECLRPDDCPVRRNEAEGTAISKESKGRSRISGWIIAMRRSPTPGSWFATAGASPDQCLARPQIEMLDAATQALLDDMRLQETLVPSGQMIQEQGESAPVLGVIVSGWAARIRSLPDGRRQILAFLLPGDLVGFQAQFFGAAINSTEAITNVTLRLKRMRDHLHHPTGSSASHLSALLAVEEIQVEEAMLSLGRRSAEERMAALLADLFERAAARGMVHSGALRLPLTQRHLSEALGISLIHTNRVISKLQRAKTIDLRRHRLRIPDPERLCRTAQRPPPSPMLIAAASEPRVGRKPVVQIIDGPLDRDQGGKRILVVEDEFHLARHVEAILQQLGFQVVGPVGGVSEAIRLSETQPIDAALLDVRLRHETRVYPVADELRRRGIPFSFMTAYRDHDLERFPREAVLRKPFLRDQLKTAIDKLID
jgi:CRP/FNR family transcriptional regulator